jgi:hypothetical protein
MSDFYRTRDERGAPVEYIVAELCRLRKMSFELNPAPEEDYAGRAAYDIEIEGVLCDIKSDWLSGATRNIAVELASLEHTSSLAFIYALPYPSGLYFHVFPVATLKELYNERVGLPMEFQPWRFPHKIVGDQSTNYAVLLPRDITKTVGLPFWEWAQNIKQQAVY